MAFNFGDPSPGGPFASYGVKDIQTKVFKLTYANFTTTNTDTLVGMLPEDASILSFTTWIKTALAGNSVSSPVISIGTASGGTQFASAVALTNTIGLNVRLSPVSGIMQTAAIPRSGTDIALWVRGGCSTGNPTSGEIYLQVDYVR